MAKVTGIGGFFLRLAKSKEMMNWYRDHLGIDAADGFNGSVFQWREHDDPTKEGSTIFSLPCHQRQKIPRDGSTFFRHGIHQRFTDLCQNEFLAQNAINLHHDFALDSLFVASFNAKTARTLFARCFRFD